MRSPRRAFLDVESIESRALMSVAIPNPTVLVAEVSTKIYPPPVLLRGNLLGRAAVRPGGPDVGNIYTIEGVGRVNPMGQVSVRGTIQSTSLTGESIGRLTIQNRFGRVELQITSRPDPSPASSQDRPQNFSFVVTRATKQYARFEGTGGSLDLQLGRTQGAFRAFRMELNSVVILSR